LTLISGLDLYPRIETKITWVIRTGNSSLVVLSHCNICEVLRMEEMEKGRSGAKREGAKWEGAKREGAKWEPAKREGAKWEWAR
jgi:hypothetical protein